ncbi:hypothetical protein BH23PAT2_BH23PAT2_00160 [soil metagenome]
MYSGTTMTKYSGRVIGAHQKIDKVARRHLRKIAQPGTVFPSARDILRFEGKNGPDGIKRKSPAQDEPWHYYSPFDSGDSALIDLITEHYDHLVMHLREKNNERASFEAAWLAHALVDGLTPAHHYPYEKELAKLRGGKGIEGRTTIKDKLVMPGDTKRQKIKNNWKMWGPKGLMTTHGLFEIGVASIIAPLGFGEAVPSPEDVRTIDEIGYIEWFRQSAREIAALEMYDMYYEKGWTPKLAYQVRHVLGPTIIKTVTLTWYTAAKDANVL